jgi:hypothetical protein
MERRELIHDRRQRLFPFYNPCAHQRIGGQYDEPSKDRGFFILIS